MLYVRTNDINAGQEILKFQCWMFDLFMAALIKIIPLIYFINWGTPVLVFG